MKVGREQIAGLLVAVERYIAAPGADDADGIRELQLLRTLLEPGRIPFNWHETSALSVPIIELDLGAVALDVDAFATALGGTPTPIYLEEAEAWRGVLIVHPMALAAGDANRISLAISDLEARFRQTPATGGEA
jgi:L-seryl-tRNA(Ser) seleniumtransferase